MPTAGAILDRFLHHARLISIQGRSYRIKDVALAGSSAARKTKASTPAAAPSSGKAAQSENLEE